MPSTFPYEQARALLLEHFKLHKRGQYDEAVRAVVSLAVEKELIPKPQDSSRSYLDQLDHEDQKAVKETVRQTFWQFLVQGVLVFGLNEGTPELALVSPNHVWLECGAGPGPPALRP